MQPQLDLQALGESSWDPSSRRWLLYILRMNAWCPHAPGANVHGRKARDGCAPGEPPRFNTDGQSSTWQLLSSSSLPFFNITLPRYKRLSKTWWGMWQTLSFCWQTDYPWGCLPFSCRQSGDRHQSPAEGLQRGTPKKPRCRVVLLPRGEVGEVPSMAFLRAVHSGEKSIDF